MLIISIGEKVMLQQEFEQRVGMRIAPEEYSHIEVVYMNSEVDKDMFCRLWVAMNRERVSKAKEEAKAKEAEEELKDKLFKIYYKYNGMDYYWKLTHYADMVMTQREVKAVVNSGIKMSESNMACSLSDVLYKIHNYLGIA